MEKLLLIMPFFMGYEASIRRILQKKYKVTLVNSEQFDSEILEKYLKCSKFHWGIRHLVRIIREMDQEKAMHSYGDCILKQIDLYQDAYNVILCINGAFLPNSFYRTIKKNNHEARFIYYAWDDLKNLFKTSHISLFDERYAYNITECQQYNMKYLPMFVQSECQGHANKDCYDIAYIASAHSDRIKIATQLSERYQKKYKLFIYLYDPNHTNQKFCYQKPMEYEKYLEVMRNSAAVLDVPHISQKGPTTRVFDALLTKTKAITTNENIKLYPVYSENISIVSRDKIIIDENFMKQKYIETGYKALTIPEWLEKIGL